jgi:8-oxo-dGTP pyrophosphatase MutT (NUDIX family)
LHCCRCAIDEKDNVLLVNQYREAVGQELLEIVAGGIDGDEEVETAVKREMQEETGYLPRKLVRLGGYYLAPGYSTEFMHLYLAARPERTLSLHRHYRYPSPPESSRPPSKCICRCCTTWPP